MTADYSEKIYENNFINLYKKDNAIVIGLKQDNNVLISSWLNGGICSNMENVINQTILDEDYSLLLDGNFDDYQKNTFADLGLNSNKSTGLLTSACMDNYSYSIKKYEELEVISIVTAGADKNGVKAGDKASFYEYNNHYFNHFGTINVIVIINANLEDGALVTASITATEAKTSVLQDLKVESQYSNHIATGTGTDGICIISNKTSENHLENAGKHSKLGELISRTVIEATKKALFLQTNMSAEYQNTVLSRLSRFDVAFDDFYGNSHVIDKDSYIEKFYYFNKDKSNVAFVSSIINLVDEVQSGLLEIDDIKKTVKNIIKSQLNIDVIDEKIEKIGDIIKILVCAINKYLLD